MLRRYPVILLELDIKLTVRVAKKTDYRRPTLGRPAVIRGIEHIKAIQSKKENHPIVKHLKQTHNNSQKRVTFEFSLTGKFKTPLARQADEALRISRSAKNLNILNSKTEFNRAPIARIKVDK